ncbi:hypothetical protein [Nocardia amamiensis]|uniref:hypothetical protein n=1 Tax=Nocardia amamiensis TaxID=404578 RepID=UPI0033CA7126
MTDGEPLGFLQSDDGAWFVVRPDGWPVEIRIYGELEQITVAGTLGAPVIDVAPTSVADTEAIGRFGVLATTEVIELNALPQKSMAFDDLRARTGLSGGSVRKALNRMSRGDSSMRLGLWGFRYGRTPRVIPNRLSGLTVMEAIRACVCPRPGRRR